MDESKRQELESNDIDDPALAAEVAALKRRVTMLVHVKVLPRKTHSENPYTEEATSRRRRYMSPQPDKTSPSKVAKLNPPATPIINSTPEELPKRMPTRYWRVAA